MSTCENIQPHAARLRHFSHCLRIQFFPGWHEEERIEGAIRTCKKYGFSNAILFINAEEYNVGHMTREEARPWVETIKRAASRFRAEGITVSLNPWSEILHLDRGRTLKPGQNFTRMVDKNGLSCTCVACPLDKNWLEYYLDLCEYFVSEIKPDIYWIEDDFRLHNHAPLEYGGCFCEKHMAAYCEKLGETVPREEFVRRLLAPGKVNPARKAWLDVQRESMRALAEIIGQRVRRANPDTEVGLMSSDPKAHGLEGRDWRGVLYGFAQGGVPIDRIHLPCYHEITGKAYFWGFNVTSMMTRALIPPETLVYPELENSSFSVYAKNRRFLRFQLESALPLGLSGMTYDIYDFVGNGEIPSFGYGEEILKITPYLDRVSKLLDFSALTGPVVPIDERTSYVTETARGENIVECISNDNWFAGYLSALGGCYRHSLDRAFREEIVAVSGQYLRNLKKEEVRALFRDNFVLMDGNAVLTLCDLGLQDTAGILSAELLLADSNLQSFEQVVDGRKIEGIEELRATSQERAGNYVRIDYAPETKVHLYTETFDNVARRVGPGMALVEEKIGIIPYALEGVLFEQFNVLRTETVKDMLFRFRAKSPLVVSRELCVSPYLYDRGKEWVLFLVNTTVDNYEETVFRLKNVPFTAIFDDCGEEIPFVLKDGEIIVRRPLPYLSTATYLLKK